LPSADRTSPKLGGVDAPLFDRNFLARSGRKTLRLGPAVLVGNRGAKGPAGRVRDLPVARIGYFFPDAVRIKDIGDTFGGKRWRIRTSVTLWVVRIRSGRERQRAAPRSSATETTPMQHEHAPRPVGRRVATARAAVLRLFRCSAACRRNPRSVPHFATRERAHTLCAWLGSSSHRQRCSSARRSSIHRQNSGEPVMRASCERSTSASQREHEAARRVRPQRLLRRQILRRRVGRRCRIAAPDLRAYLAGWCDFSRKLYGSRLSR
jgi:hypothetical protein